MSKTVLLLSFLFLSACASVNSVSMTAIPQDRSQEVQAEVSRFVVLAFAFDNDFIDLLVTKLKDQCAGGRVMGILTKDEIVSYILAHRHIVTAKGYCVREPPVKTAGLSGRL